MQKVIKYFHITSEVKKTLSQDSCWSAVIVKSFNHVTILIYQRCHPQMCSTPFTSLPAEFKKMFIWFHTWFSGNRCSSECHPRGSEPGLQTAGGESAASGVIGHQGGAHGWCSRWQPWPNDVQNSRWYDIVFRDVCVYVCRMCVCVCVCWCAWACVITDVILQTFSCSGIWSLQLGRDSGTTYNNSIHLYSVPVLLGSSTFKLEFVSWGFNCHLMFCNPQIDSYLKRWSEAKPQRK